MSLKAYGIYRFSSTSVCYLQRLLLLEQLMLALNAHTPYCWKITLVSFCVDHFSRKSLTLSQSRSFISSARLLVVFDNF